jgi:hypothetical protein
MLIKNVQYFALDTAVNLIVSCFYIADQAV